MLYPNPFFRMSFVVFLLFLGWPQLSFFLYGNEDNSSEKSFSMPRYPKSTTLTTCFGVTRQYSFYRCHSHAYILSSWLFFIQDKTKIVNHKLLLYSCFFFFPE